MDDIDAMKAFQNSSEAILQTWQFIKKWSVILIIPIN